MMNMRADELIHVNVSRCCNDKMVAGRGRGSIVIDGRCFIFVQWGAAAIFSKWALLNDKKILRRLIGAI